MLDKSPLSGPGRGPPSCNNRQLWWDPFAMTDSLTTWGTQGPAHLPTNQTQQLLPEPFCPWSPPDADDWPACPNQVTNKKVCWPFFSSLSLFSFQSLLSYPPFFCPGTGHRSLIEGPQPELRDGAWSPLVGRELQWSYLVWAKFPSFLPISPGKIPIVPGHL